MAKNKHLVQPPNPLSKKVKKTGGPSPEIAIRRALNLSEELLNGYQGWAVDDLSRLLSTFRTGNVGADKQQIEEMFEVTHGIRGEGGSFGFPMITIVADSLCKFIEGKSTLSRRELDVVKIHIMAKQAIFRQGLKGAQPKMESDLRQLLTLLRDKMSRPT